MGRSSLLLGAGILIAALQGTGVPESSGLLDFAAEINKQLWFRLESQTIKHSEIRFWGAAHGWAGILYATLFWCEASETTYPAPARNRLAELASLGQRTDHGIRWKGPHDLQMLRGWCHASAGYVHLWVMASVALGETGYEELALAAATQCWSPREANGTLCCGLAGQAYAMAAAYQVSGESIWRQRAAKFAQDAVSFVGTRWCLPNSLYKGDVGIALLACDLWNPELACMPLFGWEGWARRLSGRSPSAS